MNNSLLNSISKLFGGQNMQEGPSQNSASNMGYPETFYTTSYREKQPLQSSTQQSMGGGLMGMLSNPDLLKLLIPLFAKGGGSSPINFGEILNGSNPNLSSLISALQSFTSPKKSSKPKDSDAEQIIDISGYTEVT